MKINIKIGKGERGRKGEERKKKILTFNFFSLQESTNKTTASTFYFITNASQLYNNKQSGKPNVKSSLFSALSKIQKWFPSRNKTRDVIFSN